MKSTISKETRLLLGQRLKQCRINAGYTQRKLIEAIEALPENNEKIRSEKQISAIERGKRTISLEYAHLVSKVLNIREEYLLGEDDYKTEKEVWAKRHELFDIKSNIALQLLHLAGFQPVCDFVQNWCQLNLDDLIYGPFCDGHRAIKYVPYELEDKFELNTEILAPSGVKFYCDFEDIELLSYELIEYVNFRMKQLESKYAWRYDDAKVEPKVSGSEIHFYPQKNAADNPVFLDGSMWIDHDCEYFPDISYFEYYKTKPFK